MSDVLSAAALSLPSGGVQGWLERAPRPVFALFAGMMAFGTYFAMYAFRKPFTVASFADVAPVAGMGGIDYKIALVIAQVIGYALAKLIGVKVIAELPASRRIFGILIQIGVAEAALVGFALIPAPWNIACLFLDGLALGMVWGMVFGFVEGRRQSELIGAMLCASFILSSGVVRAVGAAVMLHGGVSQFWMPSVTGLVFAPVLLLCLAGLSVLPPPNAGDVAARVKRLPMDGAARRRMLWRIGPGLVALIAIYVMLTALRDFRDNFAAEIWVEQGLGSNADIFAWTELPVGIVVLAALASLSLVRDNGRAMAANFGLIGLGLAITGLASLAFSLHLIGAIAWMIALGGGLYLAYTPFNGLMFDRLVAVSGEIGNAGFLIYVANSSGYAGSVALLIVRNIGGLHLAWTHFLIDAGLGTCGIGLALLGLAAVYFRQHFLVAVADPGMIFLQSWDENGAAFEDLQGRTHEFFVADLVDLASEGRDAQTGQRLGGFAAGLSGTSLAAVHESAEGWRLALGGGAALSIAREAIADALAPLWQVSRSAWHAGDAAGLPRHDYDAVTAGDEPLRDCLLQVARFGFALLHGAPTQAGEAERLIARFGAVRETNYGRTFDVVARADPNNLADTALPLAPHTDNPYRADPPDLQVLHCLQAAEGGGDSILVDGMAVVEHLRATDPEAFALLTRVPVQFGWSDGTTRLSANGPMIELDGRGGLVRLRCNDRSRGAILDAVPEQRQAWRRAAGKFSALLDDPSFTFAFRLAPGDMVIMDNRRVLHGRSGFAPGGVTSSARHLQGAYADADWLFSTLFRLTEQTAGRELAKLADLFGSDAMGEPYGEDMSIRDHMLQSAELAAERRLGGAMIAAALLHDIGWTFGEGRHENVGAERVQPLFGPAIAEPIRQHVAAKRYLVATRPDYQACLSDASRHTLARQGGPMSAAECAEFARGPCCADALQLRLLDDAGKDLRPVTSSFASYAALLRRQMIGHLLGR